VRYMNLGASVLAAMFILVPARGDAQQEDHGVHHPRGLGQAHPPAVNVSLHPEWRVYAFQRDGIYYYQINDLSGQVHMAVGNVDGVFWALPVGKLSTPTSLPSWRLKVPADWPSTEVYKDTQFSLVRRGSGNDALWSVEVPSAEDDAVPSP
jgi:hypothetical protein